MAQGKKSFVIYTSWKIWLEALSFEQKGIWLDWMMSYTNDEKPAFPDDQAVRLACMVAKDQLKRDLEKWEDTKEKRVEAGRKGGLAKSSNAKQNLANATNDKQTLANSSKGVANVAVNVNDNVNVNVNDNVLSNDNIKEYKLSNDNILSQTLRYWNDKSKQYRTEKFKMPTHKAITPSMEKAINKALSLYGWNDITLAIERYAVIGNDESYYFNYVWTLEEFLKQSNALPEFLDNGSKWLNYCSSKSGIKKQEENILNSISDEEFWRVWRGEK